MRLRATYWSATKILWEPNQINFRCKSRACGKLTHGRLAALRRDSCMKIDDHHSKCNPLLRVRYWHSTAHGKGEGHSKTVSPHRPRRLCVRDLLIMSVRQPLGSKIEVSHTSTHSIAVAQLSNTPKKFPNENVPFSKVDLLFPRIWVLETCRGRA